MGIEYSGILLVGGDWEDISEVVEDYLEKVGDEDMGPYGVLEELGLEYASPYFDCPLEHCYIGFEFPPTRLTEGWCNKFEEAAAKWKELTGADAKIMGVQDIY